VTTTMTDEHGSTNGAHGGVGHLLRMAKTQCGVSLAFAALRKADGGFAIATFPLLTADPTWTIEAIDELVRQTWEDPHLGGGTVLVRSGRILKGMWTGQAHHIKLAAAALSDPEAPEHPWGLLCVAEPLAGHFEQDQLNLLGHLAVRLTSYLRARQQVLEGSYGFQQGVAAEAVPEPAQPSAYEPMVETPYVPPADAAPEPPAPTVAEEDEQLERQEFEELSEFDQLFEEVDDEHPLDRAAALFDQESIGELAEPAEPAVAEQPGAQTAWAFGEPRHARPDDLEFLSLDEIDWVEAIAAADEAPEAEPPATSWQEVVEAPGPAEDTAAKAQTTSAFGTRDVEPGPTAESGGTGDLDAMLGPDPITGLPTLTTLVGRLSASLAHVRSYEGTVGVILVEVSSASTSDVLGPTALMAVAGRLSNHLRDRDLVARIGPSLFGVLVDLRPGSVDLETIRERALGTLRENTESSIGGIVVRSATASASAGSTVSAEELLRQAAEPLAPR